MWLSTVNSCGSSLPALICDILDLPKIEAGHMERQRKSFKPLHLIAEVWELMAPTTQQKGLDFHKILDPKIPDQALGDPQKLRQIVLNLVIKFWQCPDRGCLA